MWQVVGTMDQTLSGVKNTASSLPILAPVGSKFTLFVAHDDNVAAIAKFLGGLANGRPRVSRRTTQGPAGALVFELHRVKQSGDLNRQALLRDRIAGADAKRHNSLARYASSAHPSSNPVMRRPAGLPLRRVQEHRHLECPHGLPRPDCARADSQFALGRLRRELGRAPVVSHVSKSRDGPPCRVSEIHSGGLGYVDSHPSQGTRRMGHPDFTSGSRMGRPPV